MTHTDPVVVSLVLLLATLGVYLFVAAVLSLTRSLPTSNLLLKMLIPGVIYACTAQPASAARVPPVLIPIDHPIPKPQPEPRQLSVIVQPGDSFWTIAKANANGANLVDYWKSLIEVNRIRLIDTTNPNLIYPGQRFELPN